MIIITGEISGMYGCGCRNHKLILRIEKEAIKWTVR